MQVKVYLKSAIGEVGNERWILSVAMRRGKKVLIYLILLRQTKGKAVMFKDLYSYYTHKSKAGLFHSDDMCSYRTITWL